MSITDSKCNNCSYKFYPLLTGDCPMIQLDLKFRPCPHQTIAGYEDNQFCFISCPGSKREIEITTCKFFKIPEIYWRQRYLIEWMHYDYEHVMGGTR